MFCPQCGSSVATDARFCSSCGTSLELGESVQSPPPTPPVSMTKPTIDRKWQAWVTVIGALVVVGTLIAIGVNNALNSGSAVSNNDAGSASSSPTTQPDPPTHVVAAFYDAISRKDFATAWSLLSPSFQSAGNLDKFKAGYATTQFVRASEGEVPGAPQKVRVALDANDLINGNTVHSHFEGWWVLTQSSDGRWLLDNGHFTKTQTDAANGMAASENPAPTTSPSKPSVATIMDDVNAGDRIVVGAKSIPCFDTVDGVGSWEQAIGVGDKMGEQQALGDHSVDASPGDELLLIDSSGSPFPTGALRFRILSGANKGTACWLWGTAPISAFASHMSRSDN